MINTKKLFIGLWVSVGGRAGVVFLIIYDKNQSKHVSETFSPLEYTDCPSLAASSSKATSKQRSAPLCGCATLIFEGVNGQIGFLFSPTERLGSIKKEITDLRRPWHEVSSSMK